MTSDELIARLVAIADERPNVSIGHVVEHELPELRAQAEAMNNGAARQVEQSPGEVAPITGTAGSIPAAAPPSVALPRIVREGRDFDVKFHDNGAATNAGRAHVNLGTSGSATEDAALPSAAQPVARVSVQRYKGHNGYENCDWEWNVDIPPDGNYELYTSPPDLAARVEQLDGLLNEAASVITDIHSIVPLKFAVVALLERIRAALAEGEK